MEFTEHALRFKCHDADLYGVLCEPSQAVERGVLIVVGGSQYRIGSHRQFTLLARSLAGDGVAVLRFDYRGMGDSEGELRGFEYADDDIQAAINQFFIAIPTLREVVIFGLCDAACAALFYAHKDSRVHALILANPWVRTDEGLAQATIKNYYLRRFLDRDLWEKIRSGRFEFRVAVQSFTETLSITARAWSKKKVRRTSLSSDADNHQLSLPERMFSSLERFPGQVLFILSGNDLTAQEFASVSKSSRSWVKLMQSARVQQQKIIEANHTFSRRVWRDQVASGVQDWLKSW